jgi:hypothetical protein
MKARKKLSSRKAHFLTIFYFLKMFRKPSEKAKGVNGVHAFCFFDSSDYDKYARLSNFFNVNNSYPYNTQY